jgi:restriction endonuclease Mrr
MILIDGERLAALMIRYGVGVQVKRTVHIVEVDEDFSNEQLRLHQGRMARDPR